MRDFSTIRVYLQRRGNHRYHDDECARDLKDERHYYPTVFTTIFTTNYFMSPQSSQGSSSSSARVAEVNDSYILRSSRASRHHNAAVWVRRGSRVVVFLYLHPPVCIHQSGYAPTTCTNKFVSLNASLRNIVNRLSC